MRERLGGRIRVGSRVNGYEREDEREDKRVNEREDKRVVKREWLRGRLRERQCE